MPQSRGVRASKRTKRRVSGPLSHPDPESRLGADLGDGRRVQQQADRLTVSPFSGNPVGGLAEQLGVIVGQPGEQHHSTPAFLTPQVGFGAGRFGAQLVGLLLGAGSKLGRL